MRKTFVFLCLLVSMILCFSASFAADLTLDDLIQKIQTNQPKIKDMYAETTTKITSNLQLAPSKVEGLTTDNKSKTQTMVQNGRMWTKGNNMSKIEMLSPMRQITITNGDKMAIINSETGQKMVQDLKKLKGQVPGGKGQEGMNLEKAKEFFDLSVRKLDASKLYPDSHIGAGDLETYVIVGIPKQANKFLGKMEFYVDSEKWVPVKILMYGPKDKLMSQSEIEYQKFQGSSSKGQEDIWIPVKNVSNVTTPMGAMKVEMEFENIKVNKGIKDEEFKID